MAGTDHGADQHWTGPQPVMVLVRPQMGENIGAAARAMWNFGFDRMRIVDPRDGWPNDRAVAMASGAGRVLDHVRVSEDVPSALDDLNFVYATTARVRGLVKDVLTPEEAMTDARARMGRGERVGVLFGPERAGLENEDVSRANAIINVPVNPAFGSLNLAQCVLLVAYEWARQGGAPAAQPDLDHRPATGIEVEKLGQHLDQALTAAHFFHPEDKAAHMRINLRNLLSRLPLTDGDIRIFHGIIRALTRREVE